MKKKVFSLMMTLLLAFMGVAKADVVAIGDGTSTTSRVPYNSLWGYSFVEQIYTADEIGTAGTINAISFNMSSTDTQTNTYQVFMKNVSRSTFSATSDYEVVTAADMVFSGTWTVSAGWNTLTLDTPFAYDGTSNLLIAFHEYTSGYSTRYFYYTSASDKVLSFHSDSYDPNPYDLGSYSGSSYTGYERANIQIDITPGGGGGGTPVTQTITIGEGTTTYYYYPVNMYFNYSMTEQIYTADEIGTGEGTIDAISFYYDYTSSFSMDNVTLYMKNVTRDAFASNTDMEPLALGDIVWTGTFSATEAGWITITLDTPFAYSGGNLLVGAFDGTSGYPGSSFKFRTTTCEGYKGIHWYSDSYCPDPYNTTGGFSGSKSYTQYRNNIQLTITTAGGGGGGVQNVLFAIQDGQVVDTVKVGPRPNGYWMEPFTFQMVNEGPATTLNLIDFTPEDYFTVVAPELPVNMPRHDTIDVQLTTGDSDLTEWQMVAIYGTGRTARVWDITAEPYDAATPDVWELACEEATSFPFVEVPATRHNVTLYDNYTLPFPEILEGYDAVYKLEFDKDVMLNAEVTSGANGKVALYTEDFYGEGGPMATNNYTGPSVGGSGGSAAPFQAQIGEGTSTSGYFPFYCFYNYSLSQQLFGAAELEAAGVTRATMTSLSWYCTATNGNLQSNITIWMANVEETELTSTTMLTAGMSKVYEGNMTPTVGWNEFVFNQGSFAWDGHSNILVSVQRNNGAWASGINWQVGTQPFTCSVYKYTDSTGAGYGPFDMTTNAYSCSTSTSRANIIMKGGNREGGDRAGRELVTIGGGSTGQVAIPCNFIWAYGENQMILTADEIGTAGNIMSVAYLRHSEGSGSPETRNIDIYMKHVTVDSYSSSADWIAVSAADLVFSGNHAFETVGNDFQAIELQTPFAYNGTDNLLICINDKTGTTGTRQYWTTHTTPATRSIRAWGSSAMFDPTQSGTPVGGSSLTGTWVADIQLEITQGGGAGQNDDYSFGPVIENMPVEAGTYYLVASSTDQDFEVTINAEDMPCPVVDGFAFNPIPADNEDEVEPASVRLQWSIPTYATGWRLIFGTTYHPDPSHPQTIIYPEDGSFSTELANSYTVRNLWNNTNYFWRVEFNNDGACPDGVSSPIWGFTTHLNVPQNLTAVDETVFNDETITLNWSAVVDRTYRMYNVYRDGVCIGHTTVNNIGNTTYTDGPLAYNMGGYNYYVTAVYDEGESAPSNTVNVKVSGYGDVNGHVYEQDGETGIAGATVTMVGRDEFNVSHTYNFTTNNQGYYTGHIYAGTYNGSAACNGYQTIDEPVQGNPIDITYNQTTTPIDYMLDENFDPVCTVIAEYYPDSLDPQSPYVKVYWGCGLPGEEIIEPFETGDFSQFDWQIDPTYPWSITTYQPYEGTYCMKSGGAGVANVTSNMTVTVNIPADGIMSFFGKISSESNWDYGYFYIDGVQKGSYTGAGSWGEKKFDITAGDHTFRWQYTKDGSVNSNDDCFYVDYITFFKRPEPAQPGWHTYCESEFNNAVGSNISDTPSWAYEYPASFLHANYAGWNITKVSLFSDNMYSAVGGNYTCRIYVGGTQPAAGTMVSTITVDVPSNQNAWVDWDLTTPVSVTGNDPIWVVWTANTHTSSWPAGCCGDLNDYGTWWDGGNGWEHLTYGTWTMRHWFTNRAGRSIAVGAADNAPVAIAENNASSNLRNFAKGENSSSEVSCANPNAVKGAALENGNTRRFSHYRVYRTDCYNDGPYTLYDPAAGEFGNTVVLACELHDTIYIDVDWPDVAPGVYKWGVGCVYVGNRGEEYESPIAWAQPVMRDATADNTTNPVAGEDNGNRAPWDLLNSFSCTSGYQYGVATDGNYIYTSSWSASSSSQFYKYGLDGTFIEEFNVSGSGQIRDLTYDGQYFYGVASSTMVYCLDLANHSLVNTFTSGFGAAQRGITYDPQRDGFWVIGNWTGNLTLINRTGAVQFTGPAPSNASGLAYYKDENNVEHVYCFDNGTNLIYDYDIASNTIVGTVFDFSATPGYVSGSSGGCHVGEYNGTMAFIGDLQQSPNVIGIYELRDAVTPGPTPGGQNPVQEPRESEIVWSNCLDKDMYLEGDVTVNVLLNSADSPEGVQVSFTNYNEAEQEMYPVEDVILDETGFYAFDSFRKGEYKVNITFNGYEPIEDSVSIWDPIDLRYVMIEIIYGVSDLYVSSTGWAMWGAAGTPGGQGGGTGSGDTFTFDCDGGMPAGWTTIDADGDGYTWVSSMNPGVYHNSGVNLSGTGHNSSEAYVISGSYANGLGYALTPDNYLVSPRVNIANGSTFSFWACAQDASWAAEHFGVSVSDNGTDWTLVQEWTLTAKSGGVTSVGRDGNTRVQGNWYQKTVDLSAYAGQKYIAIRHFNCTDQFILNVDDIELTNGAKAEANERHLESFKVMCTSIDGEPIYNANTIHPFCQLATEDLVPGDHYICKVAAIYSTGMSAWTECEWQYIPCENYAGTVNGVTIEGNEISWEYPGGGGGGGQGGQGDTFMIDFDNSQMPAGWTIIDGGSPTGYGWQLGSVKLGAGNGHNGSADLILSESYDNNYGVIYPDNWFISPAVTLGSGSTFSFWACGQDAGYAAEHCGVFVSTTGTNPSDFTMVQEWTLSAKNNGEKAAIRGNRDQGTWRQYTVELGAYAGAARYIAIRHFNCSDMFYLDVDDVELSNGAKGNRAAWEFFNGYVTDPGAMNNGGDASWIKGTQGTYGPGCQQANGNRVGDSFTIDAATTISEIEVYGYQTGSSTNSTFTGLYVQIYDGNPMNGGNVVWGDANANIMTATAFTNCYRGSDGDASGTTRPIMSVTASGLNIELEAGTYWLVYQLNGTGSSGPWGQPHAEPGTGNTGNGVQYLGSNSAWQNLLDSGNSQPYGVAMKLTGNQGGGSGPTPTGDVLGAMIFADGEWVDFVEYPINNYVYEGEAEEICVRIVYNGTNTLPEGNIYFSMSCPECEPYMPGQITCEPGWPIHGDMQNGQVRVWWGTEPAAPIEDWLYYDDGENVDAIGLQNGGTFYWGIKFPASSLAPYEGCAVTKVAYYDYAAHSGVVRVYQGSNGNGPSSNMIGSYNYTANGTEDWVEWSITPASFDNTQDLWIVMSNTGGGQYVASMGNFTGDDNGTMISTDGSTWYTLYDATGGAYPGTWNLRCFVSNQAKGNGQVVEMPLPKSNGGELSHSGIAKGGSFRMTRAAAPIQYNVYRSTDNETYEQIGSVAYVDGQTYYEYIDTPATGGNYYYQVTAEYEDCESDPAPAYDNPTVDYVLVNYDAIGENDGMAIFPNPTKGNVTIQAAGMQHITVVSVLGQVVYDADVDADEMILNMSQYTAGMYTVRVTTENGIRVERITVIR